MSILNEIINQVGGEYASIASEIQESHTFVDTGSYVFNALVSGSIFGGVSANKITGIGGESSTGKTFFALAVVQNFLETNPDASVVYFDSESAITRNLLESRNIDTTRVAVVDVSTIEEFRNIALKAVSIHSKKPESERTPLLFVLDSLGMLSTTKEVTDILDDKQVRDMTKAQLVKGAFRVLTLALGKANIPMIVTNHTYASIGSMYPTQELSGGAGFKYAASTIIMLSKKKEKDGTEVVGNIIHAKTYKSRLSKENQQVDVRLFYDSRGLDRYYGLADLAVEAGIWSKVAGRYEVNGKKIYEKEILKNPENYFTDEVMKAIDEVCKTKFQYGG